MVHTFLPRKRCISSFVISSTLLGGVCQSQSLDQCKQQRASFREPPLRREIPIFMGLFGVLNIHSVLLMVRSLSILDDGRESYIGGMPRQIDHFFQAVTNSIWTCYFMPPRGFGNMLFHNQWSDKFWCFASSQVNIILCYWTVGSQSFELTICTSLEVDKVP